MSLVFTVKGTSEQTSIVLSFVGKAKHVSLNPFIKFELSTKTKKRKKRASKQKLKIKRLSSRSKSVLAIPERLELKISFGQPTMVADKTFHCPMAAPL